MVVRRRCLVVGTALGLLAGSALRADDPAGAPGTSPKNPPAASAPTAVFETEEISITGDSTGGGDGLTTASATGAETDFPEEKTDPEVLQAQDTQQPALTPAPQPFSPEPTSPTAVSPLAAAVFGTGAVPSGLLSQERRNRASAPGSDFVLGGESGFRASTDAGSLLGKSFQTRGVASQNRTPIITDTRVRGSGGGSLVASGSYWFPARQDLDTMLSKIDSRLIGDMIVIKGPYAARYGPGFGFVDLDLIKSPRFKDGFETHASTSGEFKTNGEQWYGRQSLWGGSDNWGFRAGYGHRTGNDYETGDGTELPSSYNSRDVNFSLGYDPSPDSHVEFTYLRLDQTGVEFPGQIYDIDFLKTDSFEVKYLLENQCYFDKLRFETWYNATHFKGDAQGSGKRRQIPALDAIGFIGFTDVNNMSTGFSLSADWLGCDGERLTLGVDLRYLTQRLDEFDVSTSTPRGFGNGSVENFPIPRSFSANPGLFVEAELPIDSRLKLKTGGRLDSVHMDADNRANLALISDPSGNPDLETFLGAKFDQQFDLGAAFVTAEYMLCDHYTASAGAGFAMRPPTMTELYAISPFLTVMPQFASTTPFGNPELNSEKRWQVDLGLQAKYSNFRGGVNGFYAWVQDYITLDLIFVNDLNGAGDLPLYGFVNTDLATLSGFETYGEYDLKSWLTAFATMSYVEGRDHTRSGNNFLEKFGVNRPRSSDTGREEPLYSVSPLESRVGLRVQEPDKKRWGAEFSARIVDDQDRVASTLLETETAGFTTYDLRGFWRVNDRLTLVSGVENLTDKQYREHLDSRNFSSVFQPGINFYFGAEVTW